jgi:hypothetical protein
VATLACGKKGDPFLPQKEISAKVSDLKGERENGDILLKGKISAPQALEGARVYYAQYPLENTPCEGCPIEYQGYHGFGAEVFTEGGFICKVPVKGLGQVYFFRVNLIGQEGGIGPPSDRVKVVVE